MKVLVSRRAEKIIGQVQKTRVISRLDVSRSSGSGHIWAKSVPGKCECEWLPTALRGNVRRGKESGQSVSGARPTRASGSSSAADRCCGRTAAMLREQVEEFLMLLAEIGDA